MSLLSQETHAWSRDESGALVLHRIVGDASACGLKATWLNALPEIKGRQQDHWRCWGCFGVNA